MDHLYHTTSPISHEAVLKGPDWGGLLWCTTGCPARLQSTSAAKGIAAEAERPCYRIDYSATMSGQSEDLFDANGRRLYLTPEERAAFLKAAKTADRPVRSFCHTLHSTGCRISEALQLTPERVDLAAQLVTFETLKQRRKKVWRAVPVPPDYLDTLDMVHGLRELAGRSKAGDRRQQPLWTWCRMTLTGRSWR